MKELLVCQTKFDNSTTAIEFDLSCVNNENLHNIANDYLNDVIVKNLTANVSSQEHVSIPLSEKTLPHLRVYVWDANVDHIGHIKNCDLAN